MRPERERDLDRPGPSSDDADRKIRDGPAPVRRGELIGRGPDTLDDERIGDEPVELGAARHAAWPTGLVAQRRAEHELRVGEGRAGSLDRGFPSATLARIGEDAVLSRTKTDDRRGGNAEREDRQHEGLTAIVAHGVHSIERAASPRTTNAGRPMNDNGDEMAY